MPDILSPAPCDALADLATRLGLNPSPDAVLVPLTRAEAIWLRRKADDAAVWAEQRRDASIQDTESYWTEARELERARMVRAAIDGALSHGA